MYFVAILIAFALLLYWGSLRFFQHDEWFEFLHDASVNLTEKSWLVYFITVIFPTILLMFVLLLVHHKLYDLIYLLLAVGVLIYSLGRTDYNAVITDYLCVWQKGEYEKLPLVLQAFGNVPVEFGEGLEKTHVTARDCYIYSAFQSVFAVLFWFVALGPAAVFLYRLNSLFVSRNNWRVAKCIQGCLEWPAASLASLTFVLMGSFDKGVSVWFKTIFNGGMSVRNIIHANALASLGLNMQWLTGEFHEQHDIQQETILVEKEVFLLMTMVRRSIVFLIFVVAIFQIVI